MITQIKKLCSYIKNRFSKKSIPDNVVLLKDIKDQAIVNEILWQSVWLQDNEVLVYKDNEQVLHYFSTQPIDPEKEYRVLYLD